MKSIKHEIMPDISSIFDTAGFILGPKVTNFENTFSEMHDTEYCIGTGSGTDANHLALWALDIKPNDEVIIPANTFIASVWGAVLCGAKPVFVDCHPHSYNLDPEKVENAITENTKAILPVHLYGQPADMDTLLDFGKKYNIHVVEDAAQAHIAEYKNKKAGSMGITASFSFYPGKNLGAAGEAGAVLTSDEKIYEKLVMLRNHGSSSKYRHDIYGHNYRMEAIQAAVLNVKLNYLEDWTKQRRKAASLYNELLKDVEQITIPAEMNYGKHVYHLYVVKAENRDKLQNYLAENGIQTALHYPIPCHLQKCFSHLGYKKGDFPVSEELAEKCVSLPIYPEITSAQIDYVVKSIKAFYKKS